MPRARRSTPVIKHQAARLRVEQTEPEALLWARLRDRRLDGIKFRRQHAIGRYVVDFCAPAEMLVVEIDGSQHVDRGPQDAERTAYLVSLGYRVLRFRNDQLAADIGAVLERILLTAKEG